MPLYCYNVQLASPPSAKQRGSKKRQRARSQDPTHFAAPARALSGGRRLWGYHWLQRW